MRELKVFLAGKVDHSSRFASPYWREELLWKTNMLLARYRLRDSSLIRERNDFIARRQLSVNTLFSQSCFYISQSDIFVVNLTNDISVGGSQEIFIAKQFGIPVIGIAKRGGKFNRLSYELGGKQFWNWTHPFVSGLCDLVVQDADELAHAVDSFEHIPRRGLSSVQEAVNYYQQTASALDGTINAILSFSESSSGSWGRQDENDFRPHLRLYFAGKMEKTADVPEVAWRDTLVAAINAKSRFQGINLDFMRPTHDIVDEGNGKLIFGRDAFLIRSSDAVVVNLSDDISVGGAVEMMLAKLYRRPLIGIARRNGKFVSEEKDVLGYRVTNYINPFVAATCDWLIQDSSQLPDAITRLFERPVKTNAIVPAASEWYRRNLLAEDRAARQLFALV